MFFIVGSQSKGERLRALLDTHCYRCNRGTTWDWLRVTDWLSIFFIRLIPLRSKGYLACNGCGDTLALQAGEMRGISNLNRLSDERSRELHDHLVRRLEEHQFHGKSATQREFLKSTHRQK
jgi:hypothetical protein